MQTAQKIDTFFFIFIAYKSFTFSWVKVLKFKNPGIEMLFFFIIESIATSIFSLVLFFTSQSTAMDMARQSVHLAALFPGQA